MRAFGDGPCNFEPWSSDVEDTLAGTPYPKYHTNGRTFKILTDLTCIEPLHGGSLVYWARTRDKASHDPIRYLGYSATMAIPVTVEMVHFK
ncbi:hypothetical protein TNCV_2747421 [Trichonephila clavipes]|nr:hypothetical protein TNCV_2747421 [Trichonephila clavipes]